MLGAVYPEYCTCVEFELGGRTKRTLAQGYRGRFQGRTDGARALSQGIELARREYVG